MRKWRRTVILGLATGFVLCAVSVASDPRTASQQSGVADLILYNGKIFTGNEVHPYAQGIAISGERIVAVGNSEKIKDLADRNTKLLDLGGRTVIPGINDAHMYIELEPASTVALDLKNPNPSWVELKDAITASVLKSPKGTIILGEILFAVYFDPAITRDSLDQLTPDDPIILETSTGHAAILNSAALAKFGIHDNQIDPVGGRSEQICPDYRRNGEWHETITENQCNPGRSANALRGLLRPKECKHAQFLSP